MGINIEQSKAREYAVGSRAAIVRQRTWDWYHRRRTQLAEEGRTVELSELEGQWNESGLMRLADDLRAKKTHEPDIQERFGSGAAFARTTAERATAKTKTRFVAVGHAAVFSPARAEFYDGTLTEEIARGAFHDVLADPKLDVFLLWMHDHSQPPLARTRNGSLRLREDSIGLKIWADLMSRDSFTLGMARRIHSGMVNKMSFAFTVRDQDVDVILPKRHGEPTRNVIKRIQRLWDVSLVTFPAYDGTDVHVDEIPAEADRAAPAAEGDEGPRMTVDDYFADADAEIGRLDAEKAHRRKRDLQYGYEEMGRLIYDVERWKALQS